MRRRIKKRMEKKGAPPGTLVHIGNKSSEKAIITVTRYDAASCVTEDKASVPDCRPAADGKITWVNVAGVEQADVIRQIGALYNIHELTLEDVMNTDQMPKLDNHVNYVYVVFRDMRNTPDAPHEIESAQVSLIIGEDFVVTFHESPGEAFDNIRKRLCADTSYFFKMGPGYLAYSIMDLVVDDYFPAVERLDDAIYELEEKTTASYNTEDLKLIQQTRRGVIAVRRMAWPMRDVISKMEKRESPLLQESVAIYLSDLYDHIVQIIDTTETFREVLSNIFDIYLTSASNRINEVMKVLTIIATVVMPMTLITGLYGMNFQHMPELSWKYGYPAALFGMFAIAAGMMYFFRKKNWL